MENEKNNYVLIGTSRSGSSLMFRLLQASGKFIDNAQSNTEPKNIAEYIRLNYPLIEIEIILAYLPMSEDKTILAKSPEFALIPKLLIKNINSKLIFIDRDIVNSIKSHITQNCVRRFPKLLNDGIKKEVVELGFISKNELDNPMLLDIAYFGLFKYNIYEVAKRKNVIIINFDEWMNNFKSVTSKVYDFIGIDYDDELKDKWEILKKIKQQSSMRDFNNPGNYKWDSIKLKDIYIERIKKIEGLIKNQ